MALDTRWKNPPGSDPKSLYLWAQELIKELRKGEFFTAQIGSGITNAQLANMAAWTIKMRNAATAGAAQDATINDLTEETSVDGAADFFPFWDAGGSVMRKGKPANIMRAGGLQLLNSGTVSNAATLDIVLTNYTGYRALKLLLSSFVPATDDVELWMRFSTDGGTNFDATGYSYAARGIHSNGNAGDANSSAANQILIAGDGTGTESISNTASEGGVDAEITIHGRLDSSRYTRVRAAVTYFSAAGETCVQASAGSRETAQDTDAIRILFESGNIASGSWALYGYA